jgi:hypothetical protein
MAEINESESEIINNVAVSKMKMKISMAKALAKYRNA